MYLLPDALAHLRRRWPLYVMSAHFVLRAAAFSLRIVPIRRDISPARRVFAQFADVAAISWYMAFFGEPAAPLFLLYIWVTLGSGFRFGPRYLISRARDERGRVRRWCSYVNDFWRAHLCARHRPA